MIATVTFEKTTYADCHINLKQELQTLLEELPLVQLLDYMNEIGLRPSRYEAEF